MSQDAINPSKPSFGLALVPVILTLLVLGVQLFYFGDFTPHIPLALMDEILSHKVSGFGCQVSGVRCSASGGPPAKKRPAKSKKNC